MYLYLSTTRRWLLLLLLMYLLLLLQVVDVLGSETTWPWPEVTIWVALKLLQGGGMGQVGV